MTRRGRTTGFLRKALVLVALPPAAAAAGETWTFSFGNGDRVQGGFAGMRDGAVLVHMPASERTIQVAFAEIASAEPAPASGGVARTAAQVLRLRDGGALVGRTVAIRQGQLEFEADALGVVRVPGREVAELLGAADALHAYHRAVSQGPTLDAPLPAERIDALWTLLGRPDGNVAWQAHRELVRAGAVAQLGVRLRVQPDAPEAVRGWIRALDADAAEVRAIALSRLRALGDAATTHLRAALRAGGSAEARQKIAALLAPRDPEEMPPPDVEVTRFLRAIRVLEEIGTPEAQEILERLAEGAPGAPTAREALAALERIRRVR